MELEEAPSHRYRSAAFWAARVTASAWILWWVPQRILHIDPNSIGAAGTVIALGQFALTPGEFATRFVTVPDWWPGASVDVRYILWEVLMLTLSWAAYFAAFSVIAFVDGRMARNPTQDKAPPRGEAE